ncbi:MAG: pyruvate kinase [Rubrivivax sp.]|nr:pyruvate kinase [Rubrivivax sp.]
MKPKTTPSPPDAWDANDCDALIAELWSLREALVAMERRLAPWLREAAPAQAASAVNLAHFLALRRIDLRRLQERLSLVGVSSLGRAESHVLANVDKVLGILHRLAGRPWAALLKDEPAGMHRGRALLEAHTEALFGAAPEGRTVRIMVTLPSEAAHDEALVEGLVGAGMDIARINCAHDGPDEWLAMVKRVRHQAQRAGRRVRVLMDLGGPKLRTGPLPDGPPVVKLRPVRDAFGHVTVPAFLGLRPAGSALPVAGADLTLDADAAFLERLEPGADIELTDTRAAHRCLRVVERQGEAVRVSCERTVYLGSDTRLRLRPARKAAEDRHGAKGRGKGAAAADETLLTGLPALHGQLLLQRGDLLDLVPEGLGHAALPGAKGRRARPARIACTLPQALASVRKGERIWFDDGRIGGVVRRRHGQRVEVEITQARDRGERLAADKGINLPDTHLDLPALTAKDLEDLDIVARHADLVGLSFAQSAADVRALHAKLVALGAPRVGVVLKVETRRGFEHLPEMLLAAMACPAAGVMIARGDLAVECGYERMAEVQEQILWACEAAHMPVVWATQVLESLARTGLPSRAEITDAAMGERAECVMLNKGPHILDAMRMLDDILRRMQAHQSKKRPLLRALKAWTASLEAAESATDKATEEAAEQAAATPAPRP